MIRSTLLALVLVPGLAHAKKPTWFAKGAGDVLVESTVEVDLVRESSLTFAPASVKAVAVGADGDEKFLMALSPLQTSQITQELAGALGLGKSAAKGAVVIKELRIGGLVLKKVRAEIGADNRLGLGTLEGLEVAIQPSKGKVSFAPAGSGLVSSIGAVVPTELSQSKWKEHGLTKQTAGVSIQVPGTIGTAEGYWHIGGLKSSGAGFGSEVAMRGLGEQRTSRRDVVTTVLQGAIAGTELPQAQFVENGSLTSPDGKLLGVLRYDQLYAYDMGFDLEGNTFAIAAAADVKWTDANTITLGYAKSAYDEAAGDAEQATAEGSEDGSDPAASKRELAYAAALWNAGMTDSALEHTAKSVALAGDDCTAAHIYGERLLLIGEAEKAAEQLRAAGEAYDAWWSQPLDVRKAVTDGDKVGDEVYTTAQAGSCHTAWGSYAAALIAQGKHSEVAAVYEAHLDLDPKLAQAQGLAALHAEDWEGANAAFRQALNLGAQSDVSVRVGLGVANEKLGREIVNERQAEAVRGFGGDIELLTALSFAMAAGDKGSDASVAAAKAFVTDNPLSVAAKSALAITLVQAGQAEEAQKLAQSTLPLAEAAVQREAGTASSYAQLAIVQALRGDTKRTAIALDKMKKAPLLTSDEVVAEALVRDITGEADQAAVAWEKASQRSPLYPLQVLFGQ